MGADYTYTDRANSPYRAPRDENAVQAAAEQVADRLFLSRSPEFCAWIAGRMSDEDTANLVVAMESGKLPQTTIARLTCKAIRAEWQQYVCSEPDELRAEIGRELWANLTQRYAGRWSRARRR